MELCDVRRAACVAIFFMHAMPSYGAEAADDAVKVSGSVSFMLGEQTASPDSIFPTEGSANHPSLVSRKTDTVLKFDRPGSFSAVVDAQYDSRPFSEEQGRVNQLYASFDVTEALKVRIGKQRVLWGHGFTYIPTDFINPPLDPSGLDLAKVGVSALSFDYLTDFYAITGIVRGEQKLVDSVGIKFATSAVSGLDLDYIYYHAPSIGNALGVSFAADATQLLSSALSGLVLFGAFAVNSKSRYPQFIPEQYSDATATVVYPGVGPVGAAGRFKSYLAGATYQISSDLSVIAEYYGIGDAYSAADYGNLLGIVSAEGSAGARLSAPWLNYLAYGRNQRQYVSLSLGQNALTTGNNRFTDTFGASLGVLKSPDDGSSLWSLSLKSNYWDRTEVTLRTFVPTGGRSTEFGSAPYKWYSELGIKIGF